MLLSDDGWIRLGFLCGVDFPRNFSRDVSKMSRFFPTLRFFERILKIVEFSKPIDNLGGYAQVCGGFALWWRWGKSEHPFGFGKLSSHLVESFSGSMGHEAKNYAISSFHRHPWARFSFTIFLCFFFFV